MFPHFAGLYPALIASVSNMYLPCLVFPYQRVPCLWYTPVSVLIHTTPAPFAEGASGFAGVAAAGVAVPEVAEPVGAGAGFVEAGASVPPLCGLSELLDCVACACRAELPRARTVEKNAAAASSARTRLFALRLIVLFLTEMSAH
jgi:hypothetical protein